MLTLIKKKHALYDHEFNKKKDIIASDLFRRRKIRIEELLAQYSLAQKNS